MKKIAIIVEGVADVIAAPSLVAKAAKAFDLQIFACEPPIRAGEARKLMREGELERFLELAASREDAEAVILLLDLDDLCAAEVSKQFAKRAEPIAVKYSKQVDICFVVKEYECWFLRSIGKIKEELPEYGIAEGVDYPEAEKIRGAKQALAAVCKTKRYKEVRDQVKMTKHLDFEKLVKLDRSFRKFAKSLTGLSYSELEAPFSDLKLGEC